MATVYRETKETAAYNMHNDSTKLGQQLCLLRQLKLLIVRCSRILLLLYVMKLLERDCEEMCLYVYVKGFLRDWLCYLLCLKDIFVAYTYKFF